MNILFFLPFQWYSLTKLLPAKYQGKFVKFDEPDSSTLQWLEEAKALSGSLWLQIWHIIARLFLGFFMTQTSVNGYEYYLFGVTFIFAIICILTRKLNYIHFTC